LQEHTAEGEQPHSCVAVDRGDDDGAAAAAVPVSSAGGKKLNLQDLSLHMQFKEIHQWHGDKTVDQLPPHLKKQVLQRCLSNMEDQQKCMEEQQQQIEKLEMQYKQLLVEMEIKNQNFRELAVNQYKMWSDYAKEASVPREEEDRGVEFEISIKTADVLPHLKEGDSLEPQSLIRKLCTEAPETPVTVTKIPKIEEEVRWHAGKPYKCRVGGMGLVQQKLASNGDSPNTSQCDWDKTRGFKEMCEEFAQIWKTYKRVGIVSLDNAPVPGTDRWYDEYGNIYQVPGIPSEGSWESCECVSDSDSIYWDSDGSLSEPGAYHFGSSADEAESDDDPYYTTALKDSMKGEDISYTLYRTQFVRKDVNEWALGRRRHHIKRAKRAEPAEPASRDGRFCGDVWLPPISRTKEMQAAGALQLIRHEIEEHCSLGTTT